MKRLQRGLTLIELMIIVAIISILAVAALPAYDEGSIETKIAEGLFLAGAAKAAVADTFTAMGAVPNQEATHYASPATPTVAGITIADDGSGIVTITYTAAAQDVVLNLNPNLARGQPLQWTCKVTEKAYNRYVPAPCRL